MHIIVGYSILLHYEYGITDGSYVAPQYMLYNVFYNCSESTENCCLSSLATLHSWIDPGSLHTTTIHQINIGRYITMWWAQAKYNIRE